MIGVVSLLGLFMIWRTGAIPYVLVLLWAFYGIYSKQNMNDTMDVQPILISLYVGSGLLLASLVGTLVFRSK
ncbi:MAG: hypothetical protein D6772_11905 [Bacteroidetes bacterium]|nr:MAG: hypothetical protein D6772_11905 [Bacteroidota bacterium]